MAAPVDLEAKNQVATESEFEYTNKYLDEVVSFEPAGDEVVASLGAGNEVDGLERLNADDSSAIKVADPDRGFAIMAVAELDVMSSLNDGLTAAGGPGNVLPVLVDGQGGRRYFMPDELTVQFNEGVSERAALDTIAELDSSVVQAHRTTGYYTIAVPEGEGLFATLRRFSDLDSVEFAEPSEIGVNDMLTMTDDPAANGYRQDATFDNGLDLADNDLGETASTTEDDFALLWGLHNRGQRVDGSTGRFDADIDAPQAWSITTGEPNVIVAVIDTGADLNHSDLAAQLLPQGGEDWDFADVADTVPEDSGSHGSHVAGTAVGASNTTGIVGVAPGARLMPLRINLQAGMNANRADAINYVVDQALANPDKRYVINCSWRASGSIAAIHRAIRRAAANNVLVIFAAGNANRDMDVNPQYPGAYPEVISVAATDQRDRRARFSNFGSTVDVAAPGVNIYSSIPSNGHGFKDGTSMAAPHVAGIAALVWSVNDTLTAAEVRSIIESTTDNIDAINGGFVGKLGTGRVNAHRAVLSTPVPVYPAPVLRTLPFPQPNAGSSTGLAFAPDFRYWWFGRYPAVLFLTQKAGSERVYFLNPITGSIRHSVDPRDNETIGSLSWHGGSVWVANVTVGAGSINRISAYTGSQLASIPAPQGRGEGLVHDGGRIYYSTENRIHVLSASTGTPLSSFIPPGGNCRSLAAGGGKLFVGDAANNQIRVLDATTRTEQAVYQAPGTGTKRVEGLAYNPGRRELFVANQSENNIHVIRA